VDKQEAPLSPRDRATRRVSGNLAKCHTTVQKLLVRQQHPFNGPLSGTTRVSRYQKGATNLDFTEARDSEWEWHQLGHMQVCTFLQTDNHASTPPLSFLQAGCPSCRPTNSVKALKAITCTTSPEQIEVMKLEGYSGVMCNKHVHSTMTLGFPDE